MISIDEKVGKPARCTKRCEVERLARDQCIFACPLHLSIFGVTDASQTGGGELLGEWRAEVGAPACGRKDEPSW
jgi:hypothetical protein